MELTIDKRLSNRWSARASYTLSRLYGNYPGLSQTDENGRTSPNVGRSFDYPLMAFDGHGDVVLGRLPTDRPHQFKVQANYEMPLGHARRRERVHRQRHPGHARSGGDRRQQLPDPVPGPAERWPHADHLADGLHGQPLVPLRLARASCSGMDIINLFDQKTAINKYMTQLAERRRSSSTRPTSTLAGSTSRRRRTPAVQNPLLPAGRTTTSCPA